MPFTPRSPARAFAGKTFLARKRLRAGSRAPFHLGLSLCGAGLWVLSVAGCSSSQAPLPTPPAARPLSTDVDATSQGIRFFVERTKKDPQDFIALNKLSGLHLKRFRETSNIDFLNRALEAAEKSLQVMPAEINTDGLGALVECRFAAHDFAGARSGAQDWVRRNPRLALAQAIYGDVMMETGEYDEARAAYEETERLAGPESVLAATRMARLRELQGKPDEAERHMVVGLRALLGFAAPPAETVAWCHWSLGEMAFSRGRYEKAEKHYRDSLTTFPNYARSHAGLGKALAALDRRAEAIQEYEASVRNLPDPTFLAALGDLYLLAGKKSEAEARYAVVEGIAKLGKTQGVLYNRAINQFRADHDREVEAAYAAVKAEFETRKDLLGTDLLAWSALKAGKLEEAEAAATLLFKQGLQDPRFHYHAGMIFRARGKSQEARKHLETALKLSPRFDPLQAPLAEKALKSL